MAASLEIGNDWQSPPTSFSFEFSPLEPETTTNERQSPRISFSVYISQTDGISPEKLTSDMADVNYDADFEFCINGQNSSIGETLLPVADDLFVDGKILPLHHGPVQARPVTVSHHVGLESLMCLSPVRSTSSPSSDITSSCSRNVASKSFAPKPPNKWKEVVVKPSNKENVCAEKSSTSFKLVDQSQPSSTKPLWPFSRSCRRGEEMKGTGLFRSLSFSRSQSTAERKFKAENSVCATKEIETVEAWSISNKVQHGPRYYGELKPRFDAKRGTEETKAEQYSGGRGKLGSPSLPASRMRRGMSGQRSTGRFSGNGPPAGKTVDKYLFVKGNNSIGGRGGARVSPVVNVPVCIVHSRGSWNSGGGLFGFFSRREKKRPQTSENNGRHHSRGSSDRKKVT